MLPAAAWKHLSEVALRRVGVVCAAACPLWIDLFCFVSAAKKCIRYPQITITVFIPGSYNLFPDLIFPSCGYLSHLWDHLLSACFKFALTKTKTSFSRTIDMYSQYV